MLRVTGSSKIVICDIEGRRVNFATANEFADLGFVVPMRRGSSIEENLEIARETAALAVGAVREGEGFAGFDAVFECTGVEACMQTAIYVRRLYVFSTYCMGSTVLIICQYRQVDQAER